MLWNDGRRAQGALLGSLPAGLVIVHTRVETGTAGADSRAHDGPKCRGEGRQTGQRRLGPGITEAGADTASPRERVRRGGRFRGSRGDRHTRRRGRDGAGSGREQLGPRAAREQVRGIRTLAALSDVGAVGLPCGPWPLVAGSEGQRQHPREPQAGRPEAGAGETLALSAGREGLPRGLAGVSVAGEMEPVATKCLICFSFF